MIATENIAGRARALRELVGEDLADWLDVDPEEVFAEAYETKGIGE